MENLILYQQRLIASLKLLSLMYLEQEQYFEDYVDVPFEVLDTFDNAFIHLPKLIEANKLTNPQIAELLRLHNLIELTSRNPNLKDLEVEQFSSAPEWNKIRDFSKEILQLLGESLDKPDAQYR